ncbi:MAG: SDR family NAD(P)-dependent oxidoreductase, partial [Acidobacteria bacterium]|nr:SDR family NAD(P)-dependent oxidoreductase [Acidobacteriota bacterium]
MERQRFLITGASQGIGEALVRLARERGHDVVFTGRDEARIAAVATATGAHGIRADVAVAEDNQRTVDACVERMGGLDILVNNAGVGYANPLGSIDMDRMRALFDINVFGLVDLTNRVAPMLKAQQSGAIINVASTSGMKGAAGGTVYAASKWAV